jgi:hypothetical protein
MKRIGEIRQRLWRISEAVQQQYRLAGARAFANDRFRAFDDSIGPHRKPGRDTPSDPPQARRARRRQCREKQNQRDDRDRHASAGRCVGAIIGPE